MSQPGTILKNFFTVFLKGQTYLNMLYLLLSFPLGIIYFVILITGFSGRDSINYHLGRFDYSARAICSLDRIYCL